MVIKSPPGFIPLSHLSGEKLLAHLRFSRVTDEKGCYLPFDELQYHIKKEENVDVAWALTCLARNVTVQRINYYSEAGKQAGFNITPTIAETYELVDECAIALALKDQAERLRRAGTELGQLHLEEPITNSQLEGANTTTLVAREMLETGRSPYIEDEYMIAGNTRLMAEIPHLLAEPLTPTLIRQLHAIGMGGINDAEYCPGEFRGTDGVVIADYGGNTIHQPSAAALLPERLKRVCQWLNSHEGYIHPLVHAYILHFMSVHEHPFHGGSGRTSRALFYWYMLKSGYDVFKCISISSLLYVIPVKYIASYQCTESDGMDLTYFLEYQADVIKRVLRNWQQHTDGVTQRSVKLDSVLFNSGVLKCLNPCQVMLLNVMLANPGKKYTAVEISVSLSASDNTTRTDLRTIVREGFVQEKRVNN